MSLPAPGQLDKIAGARRFCWWIRRKDCSKSRRASERVQVLKRGDALDGVAYGSRGATVGWTDSNSRISLSSNRYGELSEFLR
jgi:hypothetical protein